MNNRPLSLFVSHPSHLLTDSQPHGDGLIANSLLRHLADRGHTLHVALSLSALKEPMPDSVKLYPIVTKTRHTKDQQGLAYRAEYALRVRRLFGQLRKTTHIDVVHQLNPVVSGLSIFFYRSGTPLLMGPFWPLWPQARHRDTAKGKSVEELRRVALRYRFFPADGVLSPTPASTRMLSPSLQNSDRVFPFPLAVDAELFSPAEAPVSSKTSILYLANIQRRKGVFVLLEAFEKIANQFPETTLVFAGEGYQFEELKMRVSQSRFRSQIEISGNVPRSAVPETLQECSVYCLPSLGEPYGMSALEAMSCGKPLIVTRAGGLGHLVPDQGSLKVTPGSVEELAAALVTLLQAEGLRKKMGLFNRSYVEQFHTWDRVLENLESIYHMLVDRNAARHEKIAGLDRVNSI